MVNLISILSVVLIASVLTGQFPDPSFRPPSTNRPGGPIIQPGNLSQRCPEVYIGPSYFVPWFYWPQSCQLIWVWIAWYPYPPRICYIWRCQYYWGNQVFFIYYRYCRTLFYFQSWSVNTEITSSSSFNLKSDSSSSDSFAASSILNDLLGGERISNNARVDCGFSNNVVKQISAKGLPRNYS